MGPELDSRFYEYNGWSFSRHGLWNQCKKAYFFQYMGLYYNGKKDYDVSRIPRLKKLNSKIFLKGSLIHDVIKNQMGQHKLDRDPNEESAINQYVKWVEDKQKFADDLLVESFNGESIDDSFFENIKTNGIAQIKTFFEIVWPNLKNLDYLIHEEFEHFKVNDITVTVKPDYVSKSKKGELTISDWKTGADNEDYENDLQIATYVLWAKDKYEMNPTEINSELVYLSTGNMRSYKFGADDLERFQKYIIEDFKKMNETYDFQFYPPNASVKNCNSCRFSRMCNDTKMDYSTPNSSE